jgi:hypothetical protein
VDWTYIEEGFLCHRKASLSWNPQGQRRRGGLRKSWRRMTEEEFAKEVRAWWEVKAMPAKRVCRHCFTEDLCAKAEQQELTQLLDLISLYQIMCLLNIKMCLGWMEYNNRIQMVYKTMPNHYVAVTSFWRKTVCAVQELYEQPSYGIETWGSPNIIYQTNK